MDSKRELLLKHDQIKLKFVSKFYFFTLIKNFFQRLLENHLDHSGQLLKIEIKDKDCITTTLTKASQPDLRRTKTQRLNKEMMQIMAPKKYDDRLG